MPKELQTWQIWHAMRKTLGDKFIMGVLGRRNARTIRMYAQDPRCTVDRCKDPIEALAILFDELDTCGRGDIARLATDHLCHAHTGKLCEPKPLKATLDQEVIADFEAVADLNAAIHADADLDYVRSLTEDAVQEIERTFAKYQCEKNNS